MPSKVPSSDKTEALFSKTEALFSTNDWCEIKVAESQARSHRSSSNKCNVWTTLFKFFRQDWGNICFSTYMKTCLLLQLGRNVCFSAFLTSLTMRVCASLRKLSQSGDEVVRARLIRQSKLDLVGRLWNPYNCGDTLYHQDLQNSVMVWDWPPSLFCVDELGYTESRRAWAWAQTKQQYEQG